MDNSKKVPYEVPYEKQVNDQANALIKKQRPYQSILAFITNEWKKDLSYTTFCYEVLCSCSTKILAMICETEKEIQELEAKLSQYNNIQDYIGKNAHIKDDKTDENYAKKKLNSLLNLYSKVCKLSSVVATYVKHDEKRCLNQH